METRTSGEVYHDGEVIVRQGEPGDCMFVIQAGQVEVLQEKDGNEIRLAVLSKDDVFGEMAITEKEKRCATVRALGDVRVLTYDKKAFLRRIHADPSRALCILQKMSRRIRELDAELTRVKTET
jgi:CRP-like cAMP-binding protein